MRNKEIFKIWAPIGKRWTNWVRPVPFIAIDNTTPEFKPSNYVIPYVQNISNSDGAAIIVDLHGSRSVEIGVLLAKHGFRPIPIYNGTFEQKGSRAVTSNSTILGALVWGASVLKELEIKDDAPPAFLTDTNRLQRKRMDVSIFDNSWDVYHQDLPTEDYLLNNGITKLLIISEKVSKDLKSIFAQYPKKKIQIFWTDGYNEPKCIRKGNVS